MVFIHIVTSKSPMHKFTNAAFSGKILKYKKALNPVDS